MSQRENSTIFNQFLKFNISFVPSTASSSVQSTSQQKQEIETLWYIIVPVAVVAVLLVASSLILLKRRRRTARNREYLMQLYTFDKSEWVDEMEESRSLRLGYKSLGLSSKATTSFV